ncbi:MAG: DsrE family protein [Myxococcales bacterium]|nr:DsrE family protein [Myxococcales bacterium]MDD9969259.1 DsrE family protein [Myxococcales bacterium]
MTENKEKLVIVASRGHDDERATVCWTVANGGLTAGLDVTVFLVSSAIDLVRKGAVDHVRMNPFDPPMKELIEGFVARGGNILACPPCAKVRGYGEESLLDSVTIVGSAALHALIKEGAATLCF